MKISRKEMEQKGCKDCTFWDSERHECKRWMCEMDERKIRERDRHPTSVYMQEKPRKCAGCYWFSPKEENGCQLGGDKNCAYLLNEELANESEALRSVRYYEQLMKKHYEKPAPQQSEMSACGNCPYGRNKVCIGACSKKILSEMRAKWKKQKGGQE